ncbi:MAG: RNA polymerase sigma factor [Mycobacteriales bacterium]
MTQPGVDLLALYDDALPQVYGYLLVRCGSPAVAEDLTSETFLAAVAAPGPVSTGWLIGTARHKLVDHWRRLAREERSLRLVNEAAADVDDPWDVRPDILVAREVLSPLGPHHRAALVLRHLDGLAVPEVARHLDRTRSDDQGMRFQVWQPPA